MHTVSDVYIKELHIFHRRVFSPRLPYNKPLRGRRKEFQMKLKKKEKQLPLFWRVFIISVSCALALIIVGASLFALYMSQYENSRPETLISNYIDSLGEDGLAEYIINNFPENTATISLFIHLSPAKEKLHG